MAMTTPMREMWVWDETIATDSVKQQAFLSFAASKNIGGIYFECEGLIQNNQTALRDFVLAAKAQSLAVDFLFGDANWALTANHSIATNLAQATVTFSATYPSAKPRGVHYDVEPYLLPQWQNHKKQTANQYIDLIAELKAITGPASLLLTMDIPFWFDGENITRSGQSRPLNQWVQDQADKVALMDYRDTADLIIQFAANEIAYGDQIGKLVQIGVETQCGQDPSYVSFCDKGEAAMEVELSAVAAHYASHPSYAGIAIHHYGSYATMAP